MAQQFLCFDTEGSRRAPKGVLNGELRDYLIPVGFHASPHRNVLGFAVSPKNMFKIFALQAHRKVETVWCRDL